MIRVRGALSASVFWSKKGHGVLTANDGQAGLDLIASNQMHAVILDYRMPGFSAENVAREIKSRRHRVPNYRALQLSSTAGVSEVVNRCFCGQGQPSRVLLSELDRLIGFRSIRKTALK